MIRVTGCIAWALVLAALFAASPVMAGKNALTSRGSSTFQLIPPTPDPSEPSAVGRCVLQWANSDSPVEVSVSCQKLTPGKQYCVVVHESWIEYRYGGMVAIPHEAFFENTLTADDKGARKLNSPQDCSSGSSRASGSKTRQGTLFSPTGVECAGEDKMARINRSSVSYQMVPTRRTQANRNGDGIVRSPPSEPERRTDMQRVREPMTLFIAMAIAFSLAPGGSSARAGGRPRYEIAGCGLCSRGTAVQRRPDPLARILGRAPVTVRRVRRGPEGQDRQKPVLQLRQSRQEVQPAGRRGGAARD